MDFETVAWLASVVVGFVFMFVFCRRVNRGVSVLDLICAAVLAVSGAWLIVAVIVGIATGTKPDGWLRRPRFVPGE